MNNADLRALLLGAMKTAYEAGHHATVHGEYHEDWPDGHVDDWMDEGDLTAPRVPEGWRDTLEKVRDLVAESQVDAFGVGHIEACSPFPVRDEIVDSLTKLLTAAPAPADGVATLRERVRELEGYNVGLAAESQQLRAELEAAKGEVASIQERNDALVDLSNHMDKLYRDSKGDAEALLERIAALERELAEASQRGGSDE